MRPDLDSKAQNVFKKKNKNLCVISHNARNLPLLDEYHLLESKISCCRQQMNFICYSLISVVVDEYHHEFWLIIRDDNQPA
jgi:hypothetical protein